MTDAEFARAEQTQDWLRPLGSTGLQVSAICAGGGPLGSMPENFGEVVPADRAVATVERLFDSPISFLDTSNGYSGGESERRIGIAIAARGGVPPGFVIATKVDALPGSPFDAARVRRSLEESLDRLGLDRIPLLHLHDPEFSLSFESAMAPSGPVAELLRLRDEGIAGAIGVAGGELSMLSQLVRTGAFDVVLTHNRFTIVDRSAAELIAEARDRSMGVINAAVLGGGILAVGASKSDRYAYRPAGPATMRAIRAIEAICLDFGVPLAAVAIQFSLRSPLVDSTVIGFSRPDRVEQTMALARLPISPLLWEAIDTHLPERDAWLW